jgi:hypothetical protein
MIQHDRAQTAMAREIREIPLTTERLLAESCTASSVTQCRSNPVSGRSLPKTGVFRMSAGDYRLFRPGNA